jgi:hypothetical protein
MSVTVAPLASNTPTFEIMGFDVNSDSIAA